MLWVRELASICGNSMCQYYQATVAHARTCVGSVYVSCVRVSVCDVLLAAACGLCLAVSGLTLCTRVEDMSDEDVQTLQ